MSTYNVEEELYYGNYRFEVWLTLDTYGSLDQRDIYWSLKQNDGTWSESKFVRSFYFEDMQKRHMSNFCRKFAENKTYREDSIAKRTDWAICDELFKRNAYPTHGQASPISAAFGSVSEVCLFVREHYKTIISLPEYQRIQTLDRRFKPNGTIFDPKIRPIVKAFNKMAGVETAFSCQGVSGTVTYQGMEFITVSPHARYAYIGLEMPEDIETHIIEATKTSSTMCYEKRLDYPSVLESTGDNHDFYRDALKLAKSLQE